MVKGLSNDDHRKCGPNAVAQAIASLDAGCLNDTRLARDLAALCKYIRNEHDRPAAFNEVNASNDYFDHCLGDDFKNVSCELVNVVKRLGPLFTRNIVRTQDQC